jgi:hypothetical protein
MAQGNLVLAASENYMPGVRALIRSFRHYHEGLYRIYVLSVGLNPDSVAWIEKHASTVVVPIKQEDLDRGQVWAGQYPRYAFAAELAGPTALLDADLFFTADISQWFRLADQGWIVCAARGMNVRYEKAYAEIYGEDLLDVFNPRCVCCSPLVMDPEVHGTVLRKVYQGRVADSRTSDLDLQAIWLYRLGKAENMIVLPVQQTTGVHHFQIKPDTGVEWRAGRIMTRDGLICYTVHGKWWDPGWLSDLLPQVEKYSGGNDETMRLAASSKELLHREFLRWTTGEDQ